MKLRSFRIRIALTSAVLAGSALVGFGVASWWLIYNTKVSRLDQELKIQLIRVERFQGRDRRWQSYETVLPRIFGTDQETPITLLVIGADGNTLYQSKLWPASLKVDHLWSVPPQLSSLSSLPVAEQRYLLSGTKQETSKKSEFRHNFPSRTLLPEPQLTTQHTSTDTWRVGAATFSHTWVAIAVSLKGIDREMAVIRDVFLILIFVVLLLIAGAAWWLSGSALHPIRQLTTAIRQVTVKGLEQRVPLETTDVELVELIYVFNQMLSRLEISFNQASRFSADAAHELKTPLTILQGELERTLQQAESGSQVQQRLSKLLDEVQRLSVIVRKLLLLSLADAGQMRLYRVEVDLSELLTEMAEDIELLAPDLSVKTEIVAGVRVEGDRDLLVQVLQNLISNAIKYNLPYGWIRIQAYYQGAIALVTISNSSKDISASDQERIFDRFHRGDPARTSTVEGTGLGLSLAREIARAHNGNLRLETTRAGQTAFTLSLPTGV